MTTSTQPVRLVACRDLPSLVDIPVVPETDRAVFHAASTVEGVGYMYSPIQRAPFRTSDDRFRNVVMWSSAWLYYPVEFSQALLDHGVHNEVRCHSGRIVVDGKYLD